MNKLFSTCRKQTALMLTLVLALTVLSACTAGPNELADSPDENGSVASFWHGQGVLVFNNLILHPAVGCYHWNSIILV